MHAPRYGWSLGGDELRAGIRALDRERRKPNFGNAGAVNNLLAAAAQRMEARLKGLSPAQRATAQPTAADLFPEGSAPPSDPAAIFQDLVGCTQVCVRGGEGGEGMRSVNSVQNSVDRRIFERRGIRSVGVWVCGCGCVCARRHGGVGVGVRWCLQHKPCCSCLFFSSEHYGGFR